MGPYEKAINDISDIMAEIDLPDNKELLPKFRNQTIEELEVSYIFMQDLLYHIECILDSIGDVN